MNKEELLLYATANDSLGCNNHEMVEQVLKARKEGKKRTKDPGLMTLELELAQGMVSRMPWEAAKEPRTVRHLPELSSWSTKTSLSNMQDISRHSRKPADCTWDSSPTELKQKQTQVK